MIFGVDLENNVWSWRLSEMLFEVKSMVVSKFLKWFEFGGVPSRASARSPGVEILDISSTAGGFNETCLRRIVEANCLVLQDLG